MASLYSIFTKTISRIREQGKKGDAHHKKTANCGRKRVQIDPVQFGNIPLAKRTIIRSLACALNKSKSSVARLLKKGVIRRHTNAIKPFLKEENKRSRLEFYFSMLDSGSIPRDPTFTTMHNVIHINEEWFYMSKKKECYYLLTEEEDPLRTCKSKNFVGKVMFLAGIARPRFDACGNEVFSRKIGIFPFTNQEPAKRMSVNKAARTLETKLMTSIKRETIKKVLIEKLLPAIKEKWPRGDLQYPIYIQQDNAKTHIAIDYVEFCQAATQMGLNIRLICQPANSPDLNVLDLGFFRAIQALQEKETPKTIDDLLSAVLNSFETYPSVESDNIFITLQSCMRKIMEIKGSNKYQIPHMKKAILRRECQLQTQLKYNPTVVQGVVDYLNNIST